ncbi:hypothetical protein, partial [Bradyrhizobium diazoefficiens]|uniref:hypothetical protein n=2 Tax=Nitrobacteraceae TaxID=41294 RepID=UPI001B8B3CF0
MIPTPYNFEPALTDAEYAKLGVLALRWSHIEHILGNCLKVILRLTPVGRSKSPGYGHLKLPHLMIAVSA